MEGTINEERNVKSSESDGNSKAKEDKMDLVFILDKSGSMWTAAEYTIKGFNSFIERERKNDIPTYVTLVLFDDEIRTSYVRKPIEEVERLTDTQYFAGGCTALLDAVGTAIESLDGEVSNNVMFVITTDGVENSSTKYSKEDVKKLIESHDWEFLFTGADIDSYSEAMALGIDENRAANYEKSRVGLNNLFSSLSRFRSAYYNEDKDEMGRGWKEDLN